MGRVPRSFDQGLEGHATGSMTEVMKWLNRRLLWAAVAVGIGMIALKFATPEKADLPPIGQQLEDARRRASAALATTPFPAGATPIDSTIELRSHLTTARITYLAVTPLSAEDQALVEHHASSRLGMSRGSVDLRWIPQQTRIRVDDESSSLSDIAHQQILALSRRVAEHPDLEVILRASGDSTRSAVLLANVRVVMSGAGIDAAHIRTMQADEARESANVITINVRRAGRT